MAELYAGSAAFHKAQVDKVNGDWKTVKQSIALVAVKRYLSNILTDHEKQKTFTLFLGEFVPDPKTRGKNLWDEDAEAQYHAPPWDISAEKPPLFPLITRRQKLLQFGDKIYEPAEAFADEQIRIVGEEEAGDRVRIEKREGKPKAKGKPSKPVEAMQPAKVPEQVPPSSFLPSHYNYIERFKHLESQAEANFYNFLNA